MGLRPFLAAIALRVFKTNSIENIILLDMSFSDSSGNEKVL
tara:strand:+ start:86 stop:208 length:123 start_codon:yes stop_codon:yes gene_type:complete